MVPSVDIGDVRWPQREDVDSELPPDMVLRSGDGQTVVTLRGRIVYWNEAAEHMLSLPKERALHSLLADVARTPETWDAIWGLHITSVGAHLSGNHPIRRTLHTRDAENRPITVHTSSSLLRFEGKQPLLVYSFNVEHHLEDEEKPQPPLGLTSREWEVACLLMSGLGTKEIGQELSIKYATVRAHIRNILVTLEAHTRTQALMQLWSRYGTPETRVPFPFSDD